MRLQLKRIPTSGGNLMANQILVTTPNGKVGREVAAQLLARQADVRIGAHSVEKAKKQFPGAEVVALDLRDAASVKSALAGVSAVYLAAPGEWEAGPELQLIALAKAAGVKKIVKLSAFGAEQLDGAAIRQVEKALEASGLDYTLLRPNWFMQNFTTSMAASIRAGVLAEPAGDKRTAFIDARDIAAVAVKALADGALSRQAASLSGPEALSRTALAQTLTQAIGRPVEYQELTDAQFREAVKAHLTPSYLELMSQLYAAQRSGFYEATTPSVEQLLGRPARSFDAFAREHAGVWK